MPINQGNVTLRRFFLDQKAKPSSDVSWLDALNKEAFEHKKLSLDDESLGWAVYGNELETKFSIENVARGKYVLISLRHETLKLSSSLVNLHLNKRFSDRMKELESQSLGKSQRDEIKQDVIDSLMGSATTTTTTTQCFVDTARGEVFVASSSTKILELFQMLFQRSFGYKLFDANPMAVAERLLGDEMVDRVLESPQYEISYIDPANINPDASPDGLESRLGSGFLTWLVYELYAEGYGWDTSRHGALGVIVNQSISLEGISAGAKRTSLRKGAPDRSAEFASALRVGKQVSKVALYLAREREGGEDIWKFTLDKSTFTMASLSVPKVLEGDIPTRQLGRLDLLVESFEMLDERFQTFLELRYGPDWKTEPMAAWMNSMYREEVEVKA